IAIIVRLLRSTISFGWSAVKFFFTDLRAGATGNLTDFQWHTVHNKYIFGIIERFGKFQTNRVLVGHQSTLSPVVYRSVDFTSQTGWKLSEKVVLTVNTHIFSCQTQANDLQVTHHGTSTLHR